MFTKSRNAEKAARAGKPIMWPRKPQDSLPYGVEESVKLLALWAEITRYTVCLGLLGFMVVPSIVVSKMLPGKLVAITPTSLQEYTGDPS
jgi:hypothetical protein